MNIPRKILIIFVAISILILVVFFLVTTYRKEMTDKSLKLLQNMKDIKIITRSGDAVEWIVSADNAYITGDKARLSNVRFASNSKNNINMESPECIYNLNTGEVYVDGDLKMFIGNSIRAKLKNVSIKNNLLESNSPLIIEKGNTTITGNRIKAEGERINILGNVRMVIR